MNGKPHPYRLGMRDGRWQPHGCLDCDQTAGSDIHDPRRSDDSFGVKVTDWLIRGDGVRLPNGQEGQVVGLATDGRVLVRLADGTVGAWPEDKLVGAGWWVKVTGDGETV